MSWIIQSNSEGPVIICDLGLTFSAKQIRNVDLIGRQNAERSNDLKLMIQKGFLREIKKDASDESIDPQLVQKLTQTVQQATAASEAHSAKITVLEQQNTDLKIQNDDMKIQNQQMQTKMDQILKEIQGFSDKHPVDIKVFVEALKNANAERQVIAEKREALAESGASDAEIKTQDRILALKDKKLEKNTQNIGKTISQSASDIDETLDALDKLGIG